MRYRFSELELDTERRVLVRDGESHALTPKLFGMLELFLASGGRTLTKDEILDRLWGEVFVSEGAVNRTVARLRGMLGTGRGDGQFIRTVSGVGYRFLPEVEIVGVNGNASATRPAAPFVGREQEMAACRGFLERLTGGGGGALCLTGEPGIGKTTLVEAFRTSLPAGIRTAVARCPEPLRTDMGYLPVLDVLEELCSGRDAADLRSRLKALAPNWHAQVFGDPGARPDAVAAERAKREVQSFLKELTRTGPVVLFFDDFHWSDRSTLDLVVYLTTQFDRLPLGLILVYRPAELRLREHPFLTVKPDLESRGQAREVRLSLLGEAAIGSYLDAVCPGHAFPNDFVGFLSQRTEGNPLFVTGMVDQLKAEGRIIQNNGHWQLRGDLGAMPPELPDTVAGMIGRKLEQLEDRQLRILRAAAVRGYAFESDVLARTLSEEPETIDNVLGQLDRRHGIVGRLRSTAGPAGADYQFRHALYQEVVLGELSPSRLKDLSGRIAGALIDHYGDDTASVADRIAHLLAEAGDAKPASRYFLTAARAARSRGAFDEAIALAERGIAQVERLSGSADLTTRHIELLLAKGAAQQSLWIASDSGIESYRQAGALARASGNEGYLAPFLYGQGAFHIARMETRIALGIVTQLKQLVEAMSPHSGETPTLYGSTLLRLGRLGTLSG